MKSKKQNNWPQPAVPASVVIESLADLRAALADKPAGAAPGLWSPPGAAAMHGVLWFVSLQQAAVEQFPDQQPLITLDCGDRADLAHAALREGLRSICFRGSPAMLAKLQAIADTLGAVIETQHPAYPT
jgi:hypothetical protein